MSKGMIMPRGIWGLALALGLALTAPALAGQGKTELLWLGQAAFRIDTPTGPDAAGRASAFCHAPRQRHLQDKVGAYHTARDREPAMPCGAGVRRSAKFPGSNVKPASLISYK